MGLSINQLEFSKEDFHRFSKKLNDNLLALEQLLQKPDFGLFKQNASRKIGCELELYLIDNTGRPVFANQEIYDSLQDSQLTLELNRYNLEYNHSPVALNNKPLQTTGDEIRQSLKTINNCAASFGCQTLPIGILPTLIEEDFGYHAMTDLPRYHVLTRELRDIRGGPFTIDINGEDNIHLSMEDVTLEGANTSFQIHLQVSPGEFADTYNALQMITPLATALCANSPILFGRKLWHETRIPLFKQSIDCRKYDPLHPVPARVNFGHGWIRESALEIFTESARLYQPLLPVCDEESPLECIKQGEIPALRELRLQQGSVWLWNRPVYDPAEGGHLRIEMRALPAGPTVTDMLANMVLLFGLIEVMRPNIRSLLSILPFEYCARNFYRAAERGLDAELIWPNEQQQQPEYKSCRDILKELFPKMSGALSRMGIEAEDFSPYLSILQARIENGQTGAQWQLKCLTELNKEMQDSDALKNMLLKYKLNSDSDIPVHKWKYT